MQISLLLNRSKNISVIILMLATNLFFGCRSKSNTEDISSSKPKIVNIINFIRLLEPRDERITEQVLYETVVQQLKMMRQYNLGGTFMLQYDALMDARYQNLLKILPKDSFEIAAWWEIPQPLVENVGMKWRGRYPWDWHADVGFSTGYTPQEREKLVDVYMADFKKIYGYYPKTVGSWFIDSHTLNYLYEKYNIVASCNCKDQKGTDGYTLWGGYWNQAYYPSRTNSYMPAQTEKNQLPVPIFRMLGSDPVRQYDTGIGSERQGVITLEPVYRFGGGDSSWVHWYFDQFVKGACMEFAYVQAGQENSFTWNGMAKGFEIQMPLIAKLRDENIITVETLEKSGAWFKSKYKTTPATSVTVTNDIEGSNRKTVWFNSKYYRVNFIWENGTLRIRDIHLFDEKFPSKYNKEITTTNECNFYTLPFMDGYLWSTNEDIAGFRLINTVTGELIKGKDPVITDNDPGKLHVSWPLEGSIGQMNIECTEKQMLFNLTGLEELNWQFELNTADHAKLPYQKISKKSVDCQFENFNYSVYLKKGNFLSDSQNVLKTISPENNKIEIKLTN